jgi:uridine phosphorylase
MDGMLHYYDSAHVRELDMEEAFIKHTHWDHNKARPYIVKNSDFLEKILLTDEVYSGITGTAGGFFGPQGRVLRLALSDPDMNKKLDSFEYKGVRMSNLEMETSAIYGLAKLLGHNACSMNAIIANRANMTFSADPYIPVDGLIKYTLERLLLIK